MIEQRLQAYPLRRTRSISYREAGKGQALVLLHGIGSSSATWLFQLEGLQGLRVIAWDAPGYGDSDFLKKAEPRADDYAEALRTFIENLLLKDVVLVANSLGALMAGAYARIQPERVRAMLLISPAAGYSGDRTILEQRLKQLDELGPEGMAEKTSAGLLGSKAKPGALELVQWNRRRIRPAGYRQAAYCLANGNLADDARHYRKPVLVVCGTEDKTTPEASCKAVARAFAKSEYRSLPGLGHVAHLEDPALLNRTIVDFIS